MTKLVMILCILLSWASAALAVPQDVAGCPIPDATFLSMPTAQLPIPVRVGVYVLNIDIIDTVEQNFFLDFATRYKWHDSRLAAPPGGKCAYPANTIWTPNVNILNLRTLEKQFADNVWVDDQGNATQLQRYYGSLAARFNLRRFPFDKQQLPITLVSFSHGPTEVEFIFDTEFTGQIPEFSNTSWQIGHGEGTVGVIKKTSYQPGLEKSFSRFDYTLKADRYISFYLWKVIAPLTIVVFMSWAVFWIDPKQVAVQIGVASTAILASIAFLFTLSRLLPNISYLTHMDYYIFVSLFIVFFAFIESLATCMLAGTGHAQRANTIDRIARWVFPCVFIGLLLFWYSAL